MRLRRHGRAGGCEPSGAVEGGVDLWVELMSLEPTAWGLGVLYGFGAGLITGVLFAQMQIHVARAYGHRLPDRFCWYWTDGVPKNIGKGPSKGQCCAWLLPEHPCGPDEERV